MTRITRILVPTDFSATADAALDYAFVFAERFGASVELLHVLDDPFVTDGMAAEAYISEAPGLRSAMLQDARDKLCASAPARARRPCRSGPKCSSATAHGPSPTALPNVALI